MNWIRVKADTFEYGPGGVKFIADRSVRAEDISFVDHFSSPDRLVVHLRTGVKFAVDGDQVAVLLSGLGIPPPTSVS